MTREELQENVGYINKAMVISPEVKKLISGGFWLIGTSCPEKFPATIHDWFGWYMDLAELVRQIHTLYNLCPVIEVQTNE